jgi:hypothetical protein
MESDDLRRAVEQLQWTRDRDHEMIVKIIDRIEGEIRQLKAALTGFIVNDTLRNDAAVAVVDSAARDQRTTQSSTGEHRSDLPERTDDSVMQEATSVHGANQ